MFNINVYHIYKNMIQAMLRSHLACHETFVLVRVLREGKRHTHICWIYTRINTNTYFSITYTHSLYAYILDLQYTRYEQEAFSTPENSLLSALTLSSHHHLIVATYSLHINIIINICNNKFLSCRCQCRKDSIRVTRNP